MTSLDIATLCRAGDMHAALDEMENGMSLIDDIKRDAAEGTPGPWVEETGALIPKGGSTSRPIGVRAMCISHYSGPRGSDEYSANARRIARVPQLEAALIAADEFAACFEGPEGFVGYEEDRTRTALAAFRKAMGAANE